jgi:Protein of unknown function (DUF3225)
MPALDINIPEVVAEVTEAWRRYQKAVDANDFDTMNEFFWDSPHTVRFGPNGTLISHAAIAAFRRDRPGRRVIERKLRNTVITTFGRDFAATNTETLRDGDSKVGRQSQCWLRTANGWRIVSAHVSDQP